MPITVTNLTCVYGAGTPFETTALRDVSVTVENGSFVGILGRTGCGKSTLIQIMAGLLTPTAGTVMLDGQDIHARRYDRSILRRKVGIVFQYPECQLFETTVEKDVAFGLSTAAERRRKAGARALGARDRWFLVRESPRPAADGPLRRGEAARGHRGRAGDEAGVSHSRRADRGARPARTRGVSAAHHRAQPRRHDHPHGLAQRRLSGRVCPTAARAGGRAARARRHTEEIYADLDWMRAHRLGVPQSRTAAALLQQGGLDIPQDIASYDALLAAVLRAKGGGRP